MYKLYIDIVCYMSSLGRGGKNPESNMYHFPPDMCKAKPIVLTHFKSRARHKLYVVGDCQFTYFIY